MLFAAKILLAFLALSAGFPHLIKPGTVNSPKSPAFDCYRSFNKEQATTAYFADSIGIDTRCFFASNTLNSMGEPYCEYPPIWVGYEQYDWKNLDSQINDLLSVSRDAKFICMIDLNTPYWATRWYGGDSFYHISDFAYNEEWYYNTNLWLDAFIKYAEMNYGDHIFAYVLSGGCTSEWYETNSTDNVKSRSDAISYTIGRYADRARRSLSDGKQLGVFFGYYFASTDNIQAFGHLSYESVLTDPNIDFIIAPGSYSSRRMGQGSGSQALFGTAMLHGKRLLHEIDHRPHAYYRGGSDWESVQEDIAGNLREACFAIINHANLWWFDMWGHFYDDPQVRAAVAKSHEIFEDFRNDNSPSVSQILYVADPECLLDHKGSESLRKYTEIFRNSLSCTGMPFDCYSFDDLPHLDLSQYSVIFLPATLELTPRKERFLKDVVRAPGRIVLTTAEFPELASYSSAELKRICLNAGVHEYVRGCDVVMANERLLCIHCALPGQRDVLLPARARRVTELFSGAVVARKTSAFRYNFDGPDTRLFQIEY